MGSFNKIILMGNLTRDCETRFAGNGTAIVKFGLAVNRRFQDADGNWKEQPTFVDVTIFGKRGEAFARFHTKGKQALIEGQLRMDTWDDKQTGQKRSKLYVVADSWEFAGPGPGGGREASAAPSGGYESAEPVVDAPSPAAVDETPF
jgi:single-strand DNA-binding protein